MLQAIGNAQTTPPITQDTLWKVRQGMSVYDAKENFLGIVAYIHPVNSAEMQVGAEGYVEVRTRSIKGSVFVLPEQIAAINKQGIFLGCELTALLQVSDF